MLERWRALACIAAHDLSLAKLYEGHTDALAILAEAGVGRHADGQTWGMWAAEPPGARVSFDPTGHDTVRLEGVKAWCSGATGLDRALLTVWTRDGGGPWLASVSLRDPGVLFLDSRWAADGMAGAGTVDVRFIDVPAQLIGPEGFYLERAGFWQGGVGIAACWHGGAVAIGDVLRKQLSGNDNPPWHLSLALGEVDLALSTNAALLRETAAWIDAHPHDDARVVATRARVSADGVAQHVLQVVSRALGAGPLCGNHALARMASDLPVFTRQCHADRDLAALGAAIGKKEDVSWSL